MLDLVAQHLQQNDYGYTYINGQSSLADRRSAIRKFNEDGNCTVMLASIGSAGEGLAIRAGLSYRLTVTANETVTVSTLPQRATSISWSPIGIQWQRHRQLTGFIELVNRAMLVSPGTSLQTRLKMYGNLNPSQSNPPLSLRESDM